MEKYIFINIRNRIENNFLKWLTSEKVNSEIICNRKQKHVYISESCAVLKLWPRDKWESEIPSMPEFCYLNMVKLTKLSRGQDKLISDRSSN